MKHGTIPFIKAHGLGNDFLLFNELHVVGRDVEALAQQVCDRHTNIGADGIVILGEAAAADRSFRIFNSDGSPATLSGNALRCAAAVVASRQRTPPTQITFATAVGRRQLDFITQRGHEWIFRAEMGQPEFSASRVPFLPDAPVQEPIVGFEMPIGETRFPVTILSMGNPQCILFMNYWDEFDWMWVGARLEHHALFPDRANIGFVRVLGKNRIEVRFWERGAGHTLASGTGSCACAIAAHLNGKTDRHVEVVLERGEMRVDWRADGMVLLTGPAEIIAEGELRTHA